MALEISREFSMELGGGTEPDGAWPDLEQALCRKLAVIYGRDFCVIARVLGTKSCRQVCDFLRPYIEKNQVQQVFSPDVHTVKRNSKKHKSRKSNGTNNNPVRPFYEACDHEGPCSSSNCSCVKSGLFCEKFCACSIQCRNRFNGCQCRSRCSTRSCPCYLANRECDPDLCRLCGASTPPDWISGNPDQKRTCQNVGIRYMSKKHIILGRSDVHGFGAFIGEPVQKNELITEYLGEIISQEEADRRGKIYDTLNRSYLFDLNSEFVLDAARKGNKIKFANHSNNPNCVARVMLVNGDHRVGIYAMRKLQPGEELFFNYNMTQTQAWLGK
eukprot:TRINITY_DN4422_c0_g1_i4.p1 TRINITY_DN4422_c0_g1~~TRINITY_DN4422_c0_g1_i4.p1  ORF type:complete len:329 (-),score=12.13 TRINITY_DN4422_c0_g1_i4:28-1014(-)